MNQFLDKQYRISYNIDDLPKKFTVLDNSKSKSLTLLGKNLNQKNTQGSINIAIELVFSGYFESVIKKIIEVYLLDKQYVTWAYKNCKPNVELFKHILKSFLDKMI